MELSSIWSCLAKNLPHNKQLGFYFAWSNMIFHAHCSEWNRWLVINERKHSKWNQSFLVQQCSLYEKRNGENACDGEKKRKHGKRATTSLSFWLDSIWRWFFYVFSLFVLHQQKYRRKLTSLPFTLINWLKFHVGVFPIFRACDCGCHETPQSYVQIHLCQSLHI